jgi:hypothetical protein
MPLMLRHRYSYPTLRSLSIAAVLVCFPVIALPADGVIGSSSEGTSVLTIVKQDAVQISKVDDLFLGISGSLTSQHVVGDDVCVFSSTGAYSLTVSSTNGWFALRDSNTVTEIPYTLEWVTTSVRAVPYNTSVTNLFGDTRSPTCNGSTNARFQVTINPENFNQAEPGRYRDTLTLLVQPE